MPAAALTTIIIFTLGYPFAVFCLVRQNKRKIKLDQIHEAWGLATTFLRIPEATTSEDAIISSITTSSRAKFTGSLYSCAQGCGRFRGTHVSVETRFSAVQYPARALHCLRVAGEEPAVHEHFRASKCSGRASRQGSIGQPRAYPHQSLGLTGAEASREGQGALISKEERGPVWVTLQTRRREGT